MDAERLLTVKALAEEWACSASMIYKLVERDELPHVRIGAAVRFRRTEVAAWLDRRRAGGGDAGRVVPFQTPRTTEGA